MISLANGVFSEAIPASIPWSLILERNIQLRIYEDNQATIAVVKKGFSKKLQHISRTHKVNLSSLKEACVNDDTKLAYNDTQKQAADIFTKTLAPNLLDIALEVLGIQKTCHCPPPDGEDPKAN